MLSTCFSLLKDIVKSVLGSLSVLIHMHCCAHFGFAGFDVADLSEDAPDDVEGMDASAAHVANLLLTEPADSMVPKLSSLFLFIDRTTSLFIHFVHLIMKLPDMILLTFPMLSSFFLNMLHPCKNLGLL